MEQYIVSARKYRPSSFDTVVGQASLITTLKNSIRTNHLAHAYLFCGPRGVGKTTCARIFAKTINCLNLLPSGESCNECESCRSFNEGRSFSIFEMDAASNNSVDDIRDLVKQVMVPPQIGAYSVFIIDEVHMLSTAAFNAFLKTLEEPPEYAIFILATTEKHKILPTIISRCQIYDFNRIQIEDIVQHLQYVAQKEGVVAEEAALHIIAQKADGAMRDALSAFDQIVSFSGNNVSYKLTIENMNILDYEYYFRVVDACIKGSVVSSLLTLDEIVNRGFELQHFVTGLSSHIRDLMVAIHPQTTVLLYVSSDIKERYASQAKNCGELFLYSALDLVNQCDLSYRTSKNKRLLVELTLIKICQLNSAKQPTTNSIELKKVELLATEQEDKNLIKTPLPEKKEIKVEKESPQKDVDSIVNLMSGSRTKRDESQKDEVPTSNNSGFENQDFTEDQLTAAWTEYIENNGQQSFFDKYLATILPTKQNEVCSIELITDVHVKEFCAKRGEMERFLANRLRNSNLKVEYRKKEIEAVKKRLSPEESLQQMTEKNENLQRIVANLNLEIKY